MSTWKQIRRRQRIAQIIVFVLIIAFVVAAVVYSWKVLRGDWDLFFSAPAVGIGKVEVPCPQPGEKPAKPSEVEVQILNSTRQNGLAGEITKLYGNRGFQTEVAANSDATFEGVAIIRYGPAALREAAAVATQIEGAVLTPSDMPNTDIVMIIGPKYSTLRPVEEANAALSKAIPKPEGCVEGMPTPTPIAD